MIADGAQPTAARLFLVQFSCFHEALALRGEKETKLRQATLAAAQSILAYQGEQRRLAFMLVAAANITGDPGTTYDTPGVYLVADMLAAIHQSLDQLKMSFAQK